MPYFTGIIGMRKEFIPLGVRKEVRELMALVEGQSLVNFPTIKFSKETCKGCIVGKHVERKYDKEKDRMVVQELDLIHSYMIRNIPTPSYGNSRYVLTFIYDFSSLHWWVYFLKQKYEVFETFKVFKDLVENMSGNKIKILRTENWKEHVKKKLQNLCHESGIQMQHYVPYTP